MQQVPQSVVPFSFDLSTLVPRSVASLYSHLVTRPTGRALRIGIETQIGELGGPCLSVLDFTQVIILDYSCADEAVAKLIQRFATLDRPGEVYFVARGVGEQHRDPLEAVLARHGLLLVAEIVDGGFTLLGETTAVERSAWATLQLARRARCEQIADSLGISEEVAAGALASLRSKRAVLTQERGTYLALTSLLES